jgi:hypothetical protein
VSRRGRRRRRRYLIRGYEGVKLANVERYRAELESLRAQLSAAASSVPVA